MIEFYDSDLTVLNNFRNFLQKSISSIWLIVYYNSQTNKAIKLVISNEVDVSLSENKLNEVLFAMKQFCNDNLLEFNYKIAKKDK